MNDIDKGKAAKAILDSPLWQEAENEVVEWVAEQTKANWQDKDALHQVAAFAVAHDKYRTFFEQLIENGIIAEIYLEKDIQSQSDE